MCQTCKTLRNKIEKAQDEQNAEKARVMALLLKSHQEHEHAARITAVGPNFIVWPGGTRWIVR